jgi:hypothetical protein
MATKFDGRVSPFDEAYWVIERKDAKECSRAGSLSV